ncbi:MAG: putative Cell division protein FtsX [Acidobacteria bacterium]|nr:putative Cell division protein FtsX [Acidobacteriota bacterium]
MLFAGLKYFVTEAVMGLWRGRRSTVLSTLTIAAALFVLGVFLTVAANLDALVERWSAAAELSVYLQDDVSLADRAEVQRALRNHRLVREVQFVTREQALGRFRRDFPDLAPAVADAAAHPFPASFEARLAGEAPGGDGLEALAGRLRKMRGVTDVRYDRLWLQRLQAIASLVGWAVALLGAVLALAAALTVSNVVRLALFVRRDEVEIMELVGAPLSFIKGPFVVEGILQGALGSVIALLALFIATAAVRGRLASAAPGLIDAGSISGLPAGMAVLVVAGGMAVGCLGALLAARRLA